MNTNQEMRWAIRPVLIVFLLVVCLGTAGATSAKPRVYSYANGIEFAAGTSLPVFHITNPTITAATSEGLAQIFSNISNKSVANLDTYRSHDRFTMLNETNQTILEQFGASGGFFAYNPNRAFGSTVNPGASLDAGQAQFLACLFLKTKQNTLVPATKDLTIPGLSDVSCDHNFTTAPLYPVSTEYLSGQGTVMIGSIWGANEVSAATPLRIMVTMPINLQVGNYAQIVTPIPLGGPGGHISMIFDNTAGNPGAGPSLDNAVVGLQAVGVPTYGMSFSWIRNVVAIDPAAAQGRVLKMVQDSYPTATDIVIPTPALEYYVGDPGEPRGALEPVLDFSGISLVVDGQTITLRDLTLPGVETGSGGIGPSVTISLPINGQSYLPGTMVSLQGLISAGTAPYSFDWQLDDGTSLASGMLDSAGVLPLFSKTLPPPASKGLPGSQTLHLIVTDADGITREALVSMSTPVWAYLPAIMKSPPSTSGLTSVAPLSSSVVLPSPGLVGAPSTINYRFGVEYGADYPPYGPGGPDLGAVPPDANGLSAGLMGLGWPRVFNWYNASAWEKDWRDCSLGGGDCSYGVDRADFVYYAGHGSNGGLSVPSNTHDSSWFDGTNARFQNIRWAGFASCLTLRAQWPTAGAEPIRKWFNAFQGAHMLLGFNSVMSDVPFGPHLVDNMRMPTFFGIIEMPWAQRTIAEAWVQTAWELGAGKPAYIYATSASVDPSGNKLPKVTDPPLPRPFPANWYYWVWWNE